MLNKATNASFAFQNIESNINKYVSIQITVLNCIKYYLYKLG